MAVFYENKKLIMLGCQKTSSASDRESNRCIGILFTNETGSGSRLSSAPRIGALLSLDSDAKHE